MFATRGKVALRRWWRGCCGVDAGARPRPSAIYLAWWTIVCLHTCAATTAVAETYAVRLHWESSTDPGVTGYSAYIRPLDGSYSPPQDLGLPAPETDGTLSLVVGGLDAATGYAFALTAYLADGTESGLSNELEVPTGSTPRSCASDADCIDGAAGDPCQASFCLAGTCVRPLASSEAPADHILSVDTFVFKLRGRPRVLLAHGSFLASTPPDPTSTGASVDVAAAGGMVYSASVPGRAFVAKHRGGIVRYVARHGRRRGAAGLKRLVLEWQDGKMDVTLRVTGALLAGLAGQPSLTWTVRLGEECVRDLDLLCGTQSGPVTSCD